MYVTASIVLYKTKIEEINSILENLILSKVNLIYVVDNTPNYLNVDLNLDSKIEIIFNDCNVGFGAGHNVAIKKAIILNSDFHFVINPDVEFSYKDINRLLEFMARNTEVGLLMPRVINPDLTEQFLPKLIPRPIDMLMRKIKRPAFIYTKLIEQYELRRYMNKGTINVPIISGCFSLFNMQAILDVGMYDERFFMYMEDWDISRRLNEKYKTIYFPEVSIVHRYRSEANFKVNLFFIFIQSAIKYFNKWGWIFDSKRKSINKATINYCKTTFI
jgi:GT2 family glycosyltransferase